MAQSFLIANEIADLIGGVVQGNGNIKLFGIALFKDAVQGQLSFVNKDFNFNNIKDTSASALIVPPSFMLPDKYTYIICNRPMYEILDIIVQAFVDIGVYNRNYHESPYVDKTAQVGSNVYIGGSSCIGKNTIIGHNAVIGRGVTIGDNCIVSSQSTICDTVTIGDRVSIGSGTRIGNDSFEYCNRDGLWRKIPNIGSVVIEDKVEIGANTTIDRGTIGNTIIGCGTKIDNLVQIGHEVEIGKHCLIVSQTGIAGWAQVGDYSRIYGQCGVNNFVKIGKYVTVLSKSGVTKNIKDYSCVSGFPAFKHTENLKMISFLKRIFNERRR